MLKLNYVHSLFSVAVACVFASCVCAQEEVPPEGEEAANQAAQPTKARPKPAPKVARGDGREWHVRADAPAGGDGTAARPFSSIQAAIDRARGGESVVVQAGIYREALSIDKSFPSDAPLTVRAATGAQPIISGMESVTGWKPWRDGIYMAEIGGKSDNLFAGASRLSVARFPGDEERWFQQANLDTITSSFNFTGKTPKLELTRGLRIYSHSPARQNYETYTVVKLETNADGGSITVSPKTVEQLKSGRNGRFILFNAPELIKEVGEYAVEPLDGDRTRFYFKPSSPRELENTQTRRLGTAFGLGTQCANVRISGFVIAGMRGSAIGANKVENVTVEDCVIYNNNSGISFGASKNIAVRRTLVARNYWGMSFNASKNVVVEQSEVAFNDEDGVRANGRIYDKSTAKLGTEGLTFRECYFHHHHYQGHPDNVQFFRGVGNGSFDRCLFLFGGQQLMAEQTENYKLTNSMILASINRSLNLFTYKQPDKEAWNLENNTIGFTRYNPVVATGANGRSWANVYFQYGLAPTFDSQNLKSGFNLIAPSGTAQPKATAGVSRADVELRNVPAVMEITFGGGSSAPGCLTLDVQSAATDFAVGDIVEVNGDGVARKVTTVEGKSISIAPALPSPPFRYSFVFNWKQNTNLQLDARPKAGTAADKAGPDGKAVGSPLEIAAYQKGDFDGDGKRDLPPLPRELAEAMPTFANNYIYPYAL